MDQYLRWKYQTATVRHPDFHNPKPGPSFRLDCTTGRTAAASSSPLSHVVGSSQSFVVTQASFKISLSQLRFAVSRSRTGVAAFETPVYRYEKYRKTQAKVGTWTLPTLTDVTDAPAGLRRGGFPVTRSHITFRPSACLSSPRRVRQLLLQNPRIFSAHISAAVLP